MFLTVLTAITLLSGHRHLLPQLPELGPAESPCVEISLLLRIVTQAWSKQFQLAFIHRFITLPSAPGSLLSASRRRGSGQRPTASLRLSTIARCLLLLLRRPPPRPPLLQRRRKRPARRKRSTNASSATAHSVEASIEVDMRGRVSFSVP